jgi:hypothetical protein
MALRAAIAPLVLVALSLAPAIAAAQPQDEPQPPPDGTRRDLVVRAFGAVEWGATERARTPNSFTLGQFALFATSNINERISVLAEVVMEGSVNTRVVTDLERLQLTYRWNDALHVTAGRYHTGVGFYNTAFHHGAFFETPIGRPRVFAFEDEGGVLPVHDVGLTVRGRVPKTGAALHYLVEIGNGRSWAASGGDTDEPDRDRDAAKASNVGLSYRPERWRGLEIGASYYRDRISQRGLPSLPQRITAAYVAYRTPVTEVLAEWLRLSHGLEGGDHHQDAGYAQVSTGWRKARPYYRYDRLAIDPRAPLIGGFESFTGHTAGIRVEAAAWVGVKAQYERSNQGTQHGVDAVRTQLVFVF